MVGVDTGHHWWWDGATATTNWTQAVNNNWGAMYVYEDRLYACSNTSNLVMEQVAIDTIQSGSHARQLGDAAGFAKAQWMVINGDTAYVWKPDGLYSWFTDNLYQGSPGVTLQRHVHVPTGSPDNATNGIGATVWNNNAGSFVWAPYTDALLRISGGPPNLTIDRDGTERLLENTSPVRGQCTALAPWGNWFMFACFWDGTTSYLCKLGSWLNPDDSNNVDWVYITGSIHGSLMKWNKKATAALVSAVGDPNGNPRLYVGFADGSLEWCVLPKNSPFPPSDANCRYQPTGQIYYPLHDGGFQELKKLYRAGSGFGSNLTYNQSGPTGVALRLAVDGGSFVSFTSNGGIVGENGQRLNAPTGLVGTYAQMRASLLTGDATQTPIWDGCAIHETVIPAAVLEHTLTIRAADRLVLRNGHVDTMKSADDIREAIRSAMAGNTDVTAIMPDGTAQRLLIKSWGERCVQSDAGQELEWVIDITAVQFDLAT
jgi:hypothetical protein